MENCIEYKKYKNMIYKKSSILARKYGVDFEDIVSEGFYIFAKALQKYDDKKSQFSTYLWHSLKYLEDYCKKQKKYVDKNTLTEFESLILDERIFIATMEKVETLTKLSKNAKDILNYILNLEWYSPEQESKNPNLSSTIKHFVAKGWGKRQTMRAWSEVKLWWDTYYYLF